MERNKLIQWETEIWPLEIGKYTKSGLYEDQIWDDPVFKGPGYGYAIAMIPNIWKN